MKTSELKHPRQPIGFDDQGVVRFKKNAIVDFLVKDMRPGYDMNTIVMKYHTGEFSYDDLLQFYQLIGYSVSGFGDLSAVKDEDWVIAEQERQQLTDPKFVIYFRDTESFNKGDGFQVDLKDATRYKLRTQAEAMLNDVLDGGEILTELEARSVPQ